MAQPLFTAMPDSPDLLCCERAIYARLAALQIPFTGVQHAPAATLEACAVAEEALQVAVCKNLFLCNRQKTNFYLLLLPAEKPFHTKELSKQIASARLSFASAEDMLRYLQVTPGSATVLALLFDHAQRVQLLIDRDLLSQPAWGCHPGHNTATLRIAVQDILQRYLPACGHIPIFVDLQGEHTAL